MRILRSSGQNYYEGVLASVTRLMSSLTRLTGGLLLLGFLMADFLTGLPGCGFGLGLAFFGIGVVSAADFGHGVLQSGYGGWLYPARYAIGFGKGRGS